MTHFSVKGDTINVVITMYHNAPPVVEASSECSDGDIVWMRQDWDEFKFSQLISHAFPKLTEKQIANALSRAWQTQCADWDRHDGGIRPTQDWASEANVFTLMGNTSQFHELAKRWASSIADEFANLGGDDSTYDYFPDYVDGFQQLCQAIDAGELYKETVAPIFIHYRDVVGEELISETM